VFSLFNALLDFFARFFQDEKKKSLEKMCSILKPQNDSREYRKLDLPNGMEVLLIHDADDEKASAALSVGVGFHSDPEKIAGLAHFLEHMLFLGSKDYPREEAFKEFMGSHGGMTNAYTSHDETVFFFDVLAPHLAQALSQWSAFFRCPLFLDEASGRERNAVHQEHSKNIQVCFFFFFTLLLLIFVC
jgi:insulysin